MAMQHRPKPTGPALFGFALLILFGDPLDAAAGQLSHLFCPWPVSS